MKTSFFNLILAVLVVCANPAQAHGDVEPKHGGIMNTGGEFSFELLRHKDGLTFYVEDHGVPVSTKGAKGTVTVTRNGVPSMTSATWKEPNIVLTKGVSLLPGDRLAVRLELPDGAVINGRFVIK